MVPNIKPAGRSASYNAISDPRKSSISVVMIEKMRPTGPKVVIQDKERGRAAVVIVAPGAVPGCPQVSHDTADAGVRDPREGAISIVMVESVERGGARSAAANK